MGSQLTIASVDSATDKITITGHGLVNGAGPVAIFTAAGVLPAPLAGVTDMWVIVDDVNTIRLAASSALALAGTAIDLTTNGSGTLLLLVGIPYRRATTYAALTQIKSADLDALQDSDTALWNLLTGQTQSIYSGVTLGVPLTLAAPSGEMIFGGAVTLSGVSTPAAFVAQQDNYAIAPAGVSTVRLVATNSAPNNRITGITNGTAGRILVLHNIGAVNAILLMHNATSTAANRFQLASATDLTIPLDGSAILQYDAVTARWRVVGKSF